MPSLGRSPELCSWFLSGLASQEIFSDPKSHQDTILRIITIAPTLVEAFIDAKLAFDLLYRKNSKNWDTLNYYRDCPTNVIVGFYSAILRSKYAGRITNRVDTDKTAP